jgi:Uma2 family endonuclease
MKINDITTLPTTLEEFMAWEPEDGFKYEWNDGELIKFVGMNRKQVFIYEALNQIFIEKGLWKTGTLISEYDVQLSGIQMRRPDVAYLTKEQIALTKQGEDEIPEFAIEIISGSDKASKVEERTIEYFKYGAGGVPLKVLWLIYPDNKTVQVYTSLKQAHICTDDDICSARPVLEDFEIKVSDIFG